MAPIAVSITREVQASPTQVVMERKDLLLQMALSQRRRRVGRQTMSMSSVMVTANLRAPPPIRALATLRRWQFAAMMVSASVLMVRCFNPGKQVVRVMDFFSQLDRIETEQTGERLVMVRYRARFHRDLIYSDLALNPTATQEDLAAAAAVNEPSEFLPQPWPPLALNNAKSLAIVSVIKMKMCVNVEARLPAVHAEVLRDVISHRFPEQASIPATNSFVTSCETRITHDGLVTSGYNFPDEILFNTDPSAVFATRLRYAHAMLILGMQVYLELLTV